MSQLEKDKPQGSVSPTTEALSVEEIMEFLPHRYPMLLVDRLEDIVLSEGATGIKSVTFNEWFFQGHFPEKPVMPGVLIIEAMAQTAGVLVMKSLHTPANHHLVYFMSIEEARFRKPVFPGSTLKMRVQKQRARGQVWRFEGKAYVGEDLVAEAVYTAMITPK
ncbi:MAG: 3-hydroxyacyl-ACP dehydratase FabZ [Alphaproteobacteria bacterium]